MAHVKNLKVTVDAVDDAEEAVAVDYSDKDFAPVEDLDIFADTQQTSGADFLLQKDSFDSSKGSDGGVTFHITMEVPVVEEDEKQKTNRKPYQPDNLWDFDAAVMDTPENQQKRVARARRFGIEGTAQDFSVPEDRLRTLYESLNVPEPDDDESERDWKNVTIRYNAVHVRGVDDMSTADIQRFFADFCPSHVEWIDDSSCNVLWKDRMAAAKTLLALARPLKRLQPADAELIEEGEVFDEDEDYVSPLKRQKVIDEDVVMEEEKEKEEGEGEVEEVEAPPTRPPSPVPPLAEEESVEVDVGQHTIPPGRWRVAIRPCDKAHLLLLRFATSADIKELGAESKSQYYQKYGNPHFGGLSGLISGSSRKRRRPADGGAQEPLEAVGDLRERIQQRRKLKGQRRYRDDPEAEDEQWTEHDDRDMNYYDKLLAATKEQTAARLQPSEIRGRSRQPKMRMRADDEEKRRLRRPNLGFRLNRRSPDSWSRTPSPELDDVGGWYEELMLDAEELFDDDDGLGLRGIGRDKWTPPTDVSRMKVTVDNN